MPCDGSASNFYRCIIEKVCSWGKIYVSPFVTVRSLYAPVLFGLTE